MPMHWLGLVSHAGKIPGATLAAIAPWLGPTRSFITAAIVITVFAQGIFLFNFLRSLFRGEKVEECNPWRATTLEWSVGSPTPQNDFGAQDPVVYRGAYEFSVPGAAEDFIPQDLAPDEVAKAH
jgi:cytochrome c oxidase subunit I